MVSKLPVSLLQPALLVGQQASILLAVSFFFLFKKRKGNFKRITFKFFNRRAFLSWDMSCSILLIVSSDRSGCSQTFNCCLITKVKVSWPTFSFFFQCLGWSGQRMNSWGNKQQQTTATSYISTDLYCRSWAEERSAGRRIWSSPGKSWTFDSRQQDLPSFGAQLYS